MKQFDITVTIRVTVEADFSMNEEQWAGKIAGDYANMALKYSSIGADDILEVNVKEAENV